MACHNFLVTNLNVQFPGEAPSTFTAHLPCTESLKPHRLRAYFCCSLIWVTHALEAREIGKEGTPSWRSFFSMHGGYIFSSCCIQEKAAQPPVTQGNTDGNKLGYVLLWKAQAQELPLACPSRSHSCERLPLPTHHGSKIYIKACALGWYLLDHQERDDARGQNFSFPVLFHACPPLPTQAIPAGCNTHRW